jgi:catechol 2,3-dioxygenase-like lactoylglutathione lyase family enzyme
MKGNIHMAAVPINTTPEMKLELVPVPVADIERAKAFYEGKLGFHVDHDTHPNDSVRLIQLTPVGSACSILISKGLGEISEMKPGSVKGLHLVIKDIAQVRELLIGRGVDVSDIVEYPRAIKSAFFSDPDGNSWELQEIPPNL